MEKLKYGIALTGGIATGKSTVASLLKLYGYQVIDADKIAHQVLEDQKSSVVQHFGTHILKQDNHIDRAKLGNIVFENPKELQILEEIVHPFIRDHIFNQSFIEESKCVPFFVDIPIFFEKPHLFDFFEHSLLIYAPKELQYTRLQSRNQLTLEQARQRIKTQLDIENKKNLTPHIIHNTGTLEALQTAIEEYLAILKIHYDL